jgi:beta-lactamase superfamily II metal-dependent hydrolase
MVAPPLHDGLLQVFDVEHGACSLLTVPTANGGAMQVLVDCGHNANMPWYPGEHLRGFGVTYLEQLVVTNYDEDHVSGYRNLLQQGVIVGSILCNPSVAPDTIRRLKSEDGMGAGIDALVASLDGYGPPVPGGPPLPVFPGVRREWIWNQYPYFEDENNLSLILHLKIQGFSFLYSGDMECAGFRNVLETNARFRQICGEVDVLMASHHGRENGICPEMFEDWGCNPKVVVISDDYKQHATQETSNYYASKTQGIPNFRAVGNTRKVLTTRSDGEIQFSFQGGNCWVS